MDQLDQVETESQSKTSRARLKKEDFLTRLNESMTSFDANMVLDSAMQSAGIQKHEGYFRKEEAKNLCLALIKRGGPAYRVGAGIYREYVG